MIQRILIPLLLVTALGCSDLPRDPERSLERVRENRMMRVGVSESPPWITRAAEPGGLEADLIRSLAHAEGARVEWVWGTLEQHYEDLEKFQLDLVAGGITTDSPWKARLGATRPYVEYAGKKHIVAVPPGENAWLVRVEQHLASQKTLIEQRIAGADAP